jgi:CBS domain containing-hemolysin-like protein
MLPAARSKKGAFGVDVSMTATFPLPFVWFGIALCTAQSAMFAGLTLATFSLSRLRLEIEASAGNEDAVRVRELRRDSNLTLATLVWGNVATNVVLTLLSDSVLSGVGAFVFSTFVITFLGEIVPQAYFARHALRVTARLVPVLRIYALILFPVAKPTALFLNWWLGHEGVRLLGEDDFKALITHHMQAKGGEVGMLEGIGATNFLELDDVRVGEEGETLDPKSVVRLDIADGRPVLPTFRRAPDDPFLRQLNASGQKWVIIVNASDQPVFVLDADHFIRDAMFGEMSATPEIYWHRPIVVTDPNTRLDSVLGRMKVKPERPGDDVIDEDLILLWGDRKRVITGSDLLGRLLRGIVAVEKNDSSRAPPPGRSTPRPASAPPRRSAAS